MHIAFATSEMVPYLKTGGLADVSGALPKALARLGHRVTVFLPRYGPVWFPPGSFAGSVHVPLDGTDRSAEFYVAQPAPNLDVVFVEYRPFFDRPAPYGDAGGDYVDNHLRFAFFARAILEYLRSRGLRPDVMHAHDWQAGLVPVLLKSTYWQDPTIGRLPSVFTIHNLAYQGNFAGETLSLLRLPWHLGTQEALEFHGGISYMKGGIVFAESVTTVSPRYAQEIQGPEMGYGLDGVLRARAADLVGILNGVDYDEWNPARDRHIAADYDATALAGKRECRRDLLQAFGLPDAGDAPVLGVISRLVYQKGFDVVVNAWYDLLQRPLRMVVLGTGEPEVEAGFRALAARAPDRFAVRFAYDDALAHRIMAGSDLFLMPSRYEPCGLTQMYALRYGTVPIVRATGGLVDTVEPHVPGGSTGTGFRFEAADGTALVWGIDQALQSYGDRAEWQALMQRGMRQDFSWDRSAQAYVGVYEDARRRA
jgi:starch synthase